MGTNDTMLLSITMNRFFKFVICGILVLFIVGCEKEKNIAVTSVSISQPTAEMIIGETVQLRATVLPSDATDKTIVWASSKQSVATISSTGLVTAITEGTSTITATAGGKVGSCTVTVSKRVIEVSSIELSKSSIAMVEGGSEILTATVKPDDATDKTVTWSTSDASIAKVDNGKVTALKEGSAVITAQAGDKKATCSVTIEKKVIAVTEVTLDKTSLELVEGDEATLTATVKPDDATDKTVTWSTSDASIATVQDGLIKAVKAGSVFISAKAGDISATCSLVVKPNVPKEKLSLTVTAGTLKETIEALGIDILNVQELTVSGELNGNDLAVIRTMAGNDKYFIQEGDTPSDGCLEVLDMSGSVLIPGSEIYMHQFGQNHSIANYNEIPRDAFRACIRLKRIVLPDNCTLASNASFAACYALKSIVIPSSVKTIPRGCFSACRSLEHISIPNVTTIKEYAFNGCVSLISVELGNIQELGSAVFENCTALTSISIPNSNQYFCVVDKAVLSKDKTILYYFPGGLSGTYTTPSTVEQIAPWAFCASNLNSLNVAYGVRVIGDYAFYLSNFESLTIANSVTDIGGGWFNNPRLNHLELPGSVKVLSAEIQNCPALKEIVIPDGMTTIYYAFGECPNLQRITLPESLIKIDKRSFGGTAVKEVHCKSATPIKYDKYPFTSDATVYVPKGAKASYMDDSNWNVYTIVEE